jgi:hypothetical protein
MAQMSRDQSFITGKAMEFPVPAGSQTDNGLRFFFIAVVFFR